MTKQFLYFDLGNVLLTFSGKQACAQIADVAGVSSEQVEAIIFGPREQDSLLWKFERGDLSEQEFHTSFCRAIGSNPNPAEMERAASDMFAPIDSTFKLVEQLDTAGYRLGILSNTNPWHWRFVTDGRYPLLRQSFEVSVTSFAANSMKPETAIYEHAIRQTGVAAEAIFFVDDREENVTAARQLGIDAVVYRDHATLVEDLAQRGIHRS